MDEHRIAGELRELVEHEGVVGGLEAFVDANVTATETDAASFSLEYPDGSRFLVLVVAL